MAKFRKRPVVVDAEQWFPGKEIPGVHTTFVLTRNEDGSDGVTDNRPFVWTAHQQRAFLAPGDWVIAEPSGRGFYPCKPDIFAATYEPVGE